MNPCKLGYKPFYNQMYAQNPLAEEHTKPPLIYALLFSGVGYGMEIMESACSEHVKK